MDIPSLLLPDPTLLLVDAIELDENDLRITLLATVTQPHTCCPLCQQSMTRIHSRYRRLLADLPWADVPVQLRLAVRRFLCDNPACERTIFCERIPTVALAWARRTQRLARVQEAIGVAVGGAGGSRLCALLSIDAGIDLLLALIRRMPLPERTTPQVLGVDDWAKRKGQTYGTILVDLEHGHVVELLPDRSAETLAHWLREHPGVEVVSRDRAGAYAEGAAAGAPDAVQVADRWHLLKNLTDSLHKVLRQHQSAIEQCLSQPQPPATGGAGAEVQTVPSSADEVGSVTEPLSPTGEQREASLAELRRQERMKETHRLHQMGWTGKDIAAQLNLHPKTIGRYLKAPLPVRPQLRARTGLLDAFKPYLVARWNEGCHNATHLFREILAQGFAGQISIVRDYAAELRKASGLPPGVRSAAARPLTVDPTSKPPSVRGLAHLVTRVPSSLEDDEQQSIVRVSQVHPQVEEAITLAREFAAMLRQREGELFDAWLEKALQSEAAAFRTLALGLQRDEAAVRAALSLRWSNGPTEGHINRLKCLKRQMYGRAKLDLLRQRLLAA